MDEGSDSADGNPADACQDCGSLDVTHRSYLWIDDGQEGTLLLLCEDCHHERRGRS